MSNYTPSGDPISSSRGVSLNIRNELSAIATAITSKLDSNALSSTSVTSIAIPVSFPSTISFVMGTGLSFTGGQSILLADQAAPGTNAMYGYLLSYNTTSGLSSMSVTSAIGSGTISAWNVAISSNTGATLVSNTFTGFQNFARATVVSHATTADIWAALGNQIDWTGTATTTAFPNAPQGGASRRLICAGACSFTAGANLLIDGVASGSTMTCAANDTVIVEAISITQFKLTRLRYDGRVQVSAGNHVVTVTTGIGYATTNTMIRRYTTIQENVGTAITYADSAALGASFTINEPGLYEIYRIDSNNGGSLNYGVSLNSAALTTSIVSITAATRVLYGSHGTVVGDPTTPICRTLSLTTGDVIRPHDDAAADDTTALKSVFSIRKVGYV